MSRTTKHLTLPLTLLLAASAAVTLMFAGGVRQAEAAELSCPTFRVLNNDRIGKLNLPKGTYDVTVLDGDRLSCPAASKLFAEFLQDFDGKLRKPWVVNVSGKSFTRGKNSRTGFRVRKSSGGGGGGGGTKASCPGYFTVVHNDSIGSFRVPRGRYRITLIDSKALTCAQAVKRFKEFLQDYDGKLPRAWRLKKSSATFYKPKHPRIGFDINRVYGPTPGPKPGPNRRYARCPGTFQVQHNDRIGALKLPKGPYYVTVGTRVPLSCKSASSLFAQFLQRTDGRLPRPWRLNAAKALFRAGSGGAVFRVQQAR